MLKFSIIALLVRLHLRRHCLSEWTPPAESTGNITPIVHQSQSLLVSLAYVLEMADHCLHVFREVLFDIVNNNVKLRDSVHIIVLVTIQNIFFHL